jgi:hypothetical protein
MKTDKNIFPNLSAGLLIYESGLTASNLDSIFNPLFAVFEMPDPIEHSLQ